MTVRPIATTIPTGNTVEQLHALADIVIERQRQDRKFPEQAPGQPGAEIAPLLAGLIREVGEVAKAELEQGDEKVRRELIQVAAVSVKWLEILDRKARRNRSSHAVETTDHALTGEIRMVESEV